MVDAASMITLQLGASAAVGFITAYSLRKIIQALMIIVGILILGLFGVASTGSISISWDKLFGVAITSGIFSSWSLFLEHLPVTAGFGLGFIYGLRETPPEEEEPTEKKSVESDEGYAVSNGS